MYFWCIYLVWMLETCIMSLFFSAVLPCRWKKLSKGVIMLILIGASLIPAYYKLKYSIDTYSMEYKVINTIQMAVFAVYVCVFYKCSFWIKALAFILLMIANVLSAAVSQFSAGLMGWKIDYSNWNLDTFKIYCIVIFPYAFICMLIMMIWNKTLHSEYKISNFWLFTFFPVAQFLITFASVNHFYYNIDILAIISLFVGVITDLVLLYVLMNQSEKEHLEKQMKEWEQILAIEAVHYEELEAKRMELAKFRHDYNNQLTPAILLEEQGNREMAGQIIKQLRESVK